MPARCPSPAGRRREAATTSRARRQAGAQDGPLPDRPGRHLRGSDAPTGRPDRRSGGPTARSGTNAAGLGWTNPYDRRVWDYNVSIAEAAARAGFDEIQFDYVRFPSDGDIETAVSRTRRRRRIRVGDPAVRPVRLEAAQAARRALSADVFGLSATRDLGIGQMPRRTRAYLDAVYPMTYPSHYSAGEYGIADPGAQPGETVFNSLADFRRELRGRKTQHRPVGAGLHARPDVHADRGAGADRVGAAPGRARLPALESERRRTYGALVPPGELDGLGRDSNERRRHDGERGDTIAGTT